MNYSRRILTLTVVLLMVGGVLAASGCLDGDDDDDKVVIPDDRKDAKLWMIGSDDDKMVTIQEIVDLGLEDFEATFVNSVGTTYTANYTGVLLSDLLDMVNLSDDMDLLWIFAGDGYRVTMYLGDVDDDTYVALMEDGEWNDIDDMGVFRLVDTDLPSAYWVRDMETVQAARSGAIWSGGYTDERWLINMGWIKERSSREVSWQEGEKTRTYTGVPMSEVLTAVGADDTISDTLGIGTMSELHEPVDLAIAREKAVLLVNSRGEYVYYHGPEDERVEVISRFYVGTTVSIDGEVDLPYSMDALALADNDQVDVPIETFNRSGEIFLGAPLSWLVAHSAPDMDVDAVRVIARDGYFAVFPMSGLTSAMLVHMDEDGEPLPIEDGPFQIMDSARPGPFWVRDVVDIEVFTTTAIDASGAVNVTDALDLGFIVSNADTTITYFDGRKDRSYDGLTWDEVLAFLDYDTTATTVKLVDKDMEFVEWDIVELLGSPDSGICVDSRGSYVAYHSGNDEAFFDLVSLEVS